VTLVYFVLLAVAAVVCFLPLLRYFFAQDDFILMHNAVRDGGRAITTFFSQAPGQFRPLTKGLYFLSMYKAFGLNAAPYHAVSIFVHILNSVLFFLLMKRCRISAAASLVSTTLFALSVAFFHVIGWVSCIQQLLGQCFMLTALVFGIDHLRSGSKHSKWASIAAYVLALLSLEQTFAMPIILLVFARLNVGGWAEPLPVQRAVGRLAEHLTIMVVYLLFVGVYKGAPQEGVYTFALGTNVFKNLSTYLGWTLHFGVALPLRINAGIDGIARAHIALAVLLMYQLLLRRFGPLLFGFSYFLLAIMPTLFLQNHTFYLHTYVAAFGILYLVAIVVDDILSTPVFRPRAVQYASLFAVLAALTAMSFVMVRKNEAYRMFGIKDYARSFVLRRAKIASYVYDSIADLKPLDPRVQKVYMVYGIEGGDDEARWNKGNVEAAMGMGSLINLIYDKPDMDVILCNFGDAVDKSELEISDIYFYDDVGNCRKLELKDLERPD
jgi:hypothetical protein